MNTNKQTSRGQVIGPSAPKDGSYVKSNMAPAKALGIFNGLSQGAKHVFGMVKKRGKRFLDQKEYKQYFDLVNDKAKDLPKEGGIFNSILDALEGAPVIGDLVKVGRSAKSLLKEHTGIDLPFGDGLIGIGQTAQEFYNGTRKWDSPWRNDDDGLHAAAVVPYAPAGRTTTKPKLVGLLTQRSPGLVPRPQLPQAIKSSLPQKVASTFASASQMNASPVLASLWSKVKSAFSPAPPRFVERSGLGNGETNELATNYSVDKTMREPHIVTTEHYVEITHNEYIMDLALMTDGQGNPRADNTFGIDASIGLNPGNVNMFPWLSTLAGGFQEYEFGALTFELATTVGSARDGAVAMAVSPDASDPPPESKRELLNLVGASRGAVWQPCIYDHTASSLINGVLKFRFVRGIAIPINTDVKMYDAGRFYVGSSDGTSSAMPIMELWVSYVVRLAKPVLAPAPAACLSLRAYGAAASSPQEVAAANLGSLNGRVVYPLKDPLFVSQRVGPALNFAPLQAAPGVPGNLVSDSITISEPGVYLAVTSCQTTNTPNVEGGAASCPLSVFTDSPERVSFGTYGPVIGDVNNNAVGFGLPGSAFDPVEFRSNMACGNVGGEVGIITPERSWGSSWFTPPAAGPMSGAFSCFAYMFIKVIGSLDGGSQPARIWWAFPDPATGTLATIGNYGSLVQMITRVPSTYATRLADALSQPVDDLMATLPHAPLTYKSLESEISDLRLTLAQTTKEKDKLVKKLANL